MKLAGVIGVEWSPEEYHITTNTSESHFVFRCIGQSLPTIHDPGSPKKVYDLIPSSEVTEGDVLFKRAEGEVLCLQKN
jgi:hypothetical protein